MPIQRRIPAQTGKAMDVTIDEFCQAEEAALNYPLLYNQTATTSFSQLKGTMALQTHMSETRPFLEDTFEALLLRSST